MQKINLWLAWLIFGILVVLGYLFVSSCSRPSQLSLPHPNGIGKNKNIPHYEKGKIIFRKK